LKYLSATKQFDKLVHELPWKEREKSIDTLKLFATALGAGKFSRGFGLKKIAADLYEIRVDIRLRILMKAKEDSLICFLIGSHDDIRKYLKECGSR